VDVYGLGAVLYEALTGRPPVEVESLAELPAATRRGPEPVHEAAPEVPRSLEDAVMWALARRPEERPASPAELAAALELEAAEAPTVRLPRPPAAARTHRRRAAAAGAVVLAAAGTAIALAVARPDSGPAPVEPVPRHADAGRQARALADWLRRNSEG